MVRIPSDREPTHPGEMLLREFLAPLGMTRHVPSLPLGVSFLRSG